MDCELAVELKAVDTGPWEITFCVCGVCMGYALLGVSSMDQKVDRFTTLKENSAQWIQGATDPSVDGSNGR